jgi:glyoxylase-like metal-dependent hydrolase (beta-lactamase superfamily II)
MDHTDSVANIEIPIPDSLVVPMDAIAADIEGLRIAFVNVFGVRNAADSWTLIDAGLPFSAALIRRWAEKRFGKPPLAIVLTHGHFDHISAASELADQWDVPIYAHNLEAPYLTGKEQYAPPDTRVGGGLMTILSPLYPKGPIDLGRRLRLFPDYGSGHRISELSEWEILHTPGHTPGHISLYRPADRVLLVGDAFCTTKPESFFDVAIAQPAELHGPPSYFTSDWPQAVGSIRRLADLHPLVIAPGHGKPLAGQAVEKQLSRLVSQFASAAIVMAPDIPEVDPDRYLDPGN